MTEWRLPSDPDARARMREQWREFGDLMQGYRLAVTGEHTNGEAHLYDKPLPGAVARKCAACPAMFKPTAKRRMLCASCFKSGGPLREF